MLKDKILTNISPYRTTGLALYRNSAGDRWVRADKAKKKPLRLSEGLCLI